MVPTFTTESIKELGARLCPGGLDTDFDDSGHRYAVSVTDSWEVRCQHADRRAVSRVTDSRIAFWAP